MELLIERISDINHIIAPNLAPVRTKRLASCHKDKNVHFGSSLCPKRQRYEQTLQMTVLLNHLTPPFVSKQAVCNVNRDHDSHVLHFGFYHKFQPQQIEEVNLTLFPSLWAGPMSAPHQINIINSYLVTLYYLADNFIQSDLQQKQDPIQIY